MSLSTDQQTAAPGATAVTYHRVASIHDPGTSGHGEGSAIRRQQEATRRKATQLGATVLEEFTDLDMSGCTTSRPALQQMLAYIDARDVTYCVVADIARLARDGSLYVMIRDPLAPAGVTLVSCEDATDGSPTSDFVHKLTSTMAVLSAEDLPVAGSDGPPAHPMSSPTANVDRRQRGGVVR